MASDAPASLLELMAGEDRIREFVAGPYQRLLRTDGERRPRRRMTPSDLVGFARGVDQLPRGCDSDLDASVVGCHSGDVSCRSATRNRISGLHYPVSASAGAH